MTTTGFTPVPAVSNTPSTGEVMESLKQSATMIRAAAIQAQEGSPEQAELRQRAHLRESMARRLEEMAKSGIELFAGADGPGEEKILMRAADDG